MRITAAHVLMPILCLGVGIVLIHVGLFCAWGLVWAVAGGFFVTVMTTLDSANWIMAQRRTPA